jgi:hypothetical protein
MDDWCPAIDKHERLSTCCGKPEMGLVEGMCGYCRDWATIEECCPRYEWEACQWVDSGGQEEPFDEEVTASQRTTWEVKRW